MNNLRQPLDRRIRFLTGHPLAPLAVLTAFLLIFQVHLVSRAKVLYSVLEGLFFILLAVSILGFVRAARGRPLLWAALVLFLLIRVPFYLHANGTILTSDNAHEALQGVEMRDARQAPFFLLGMSNHMGTVKYLWVAFLWDLTGNVYLIYLLVQAAVFMALLTALTALLGPTGPPGFLRVFLLLLQFAFIEVVFDYSLSLRGAPYLEMLLFFVIGAALFDFTFEQRWRLLVGSYFVFFSIYIHPLAAVLAGSFAACAALYALARRRFWRNAVWMAAGLVAGLYHWFYYLAFLPKPVARGGWENIGLLNMARIPAGYVRLFLTSLAHTFRGVFGAEFSYLSPVYQKAGAAAAYVLLNSVVMWMSLAVLVAAAALSLGTVIRLVRRREAAGAGNWLKPFWLILLGVFLVKVFLFAPPHTEPRHNFDLVLLIILSYLFIADMVARRWRIRRGVFAAVLLIFAIFTVPHYDAFLRNVLDKESSYRSLLTALHRYRVHYVTTDFILAYPIYFLSGRTIIATDSLGPFTVMNFYPQLRDLVDRQPLEGKTYIFYAKTYPLRPQDKYLTWLIKTRILKHLQEAGLPYHLVNLKDYVLIIPRAKPP
jgi:hypothetical protein